MTHIKVSRTKQLFGCFSDDDGDGGDKASQKMKLYIIFEYLSSADLFSTTIGLNSCSG